MIFRLKPEATMQPGDSKQPDFRLKPEPTGRSFRL